MNRIKDQKAAAERWFNEYSPSCMEMYQQNNKNSVGCRVEFNGDVGYEIGEGSDKHTVFIDKQLCTCRA